MSQVKPGLQNFLCFLNILIANFYENLVYIASIFPFSMALLCHSIECHSFNHFFVHGLSVKAINTVLQFLKVGSHCEAMLDVTKNVFY